MSHPFRENKIDQAQSRKAVEFLFEKDDGKQGDSSKFLDMRTEIGSAEMFKAVTYYRILEEHFKSSASGKIANILERLAISGKRMARLEAVEILKQQFPKQETITQGISELLATSKLESEG